MFSLGGVKSCYRLHKILELSAGGSVELRFFKAMKKLPHTVSYSIGGDQALLKILHGRFSQHQKNGLFESGAMNVDTGFSTKCLMKALTSHTTVPFNFQMAKKGCVGADTTAHNNATTIAPSHTKKVVHTFSCAAAPLPLLLIYT